MIKSFFQTIIPALAGFAAADRWVFDYLDNNLYARNKR